jgi:hypothetical protein
MTEFTEEQQMLVLEILYTLKHNELTRVIVAETMDLCDAEMFEVLDKAEEILNKQAKQNPN